MNVDPRWGLYFTTEFAGFAMVVGGMWLLYKQKIFIDKESGQPVEISLPGNITLKSNYPALALFVLGFFPLIYPFQQLSKLDDYPHVVHVRLTGKPEHGIYPSQVWASFRPGPVQQDGQKFYVDVPIIYDNRLEPFYVMLEASDTIVGHATVTPDMVEKKENNAEIPVTIEMNNYAAPDFATVNAPAPKGFK